MSHDAYHTLLSNRFVCEACLTRFFKRYGRCPACDKIGQVHPLRNSLYIIARSHTELCDLISSGQNISQEWTITPTSHHPV